MAGRIGRLQVRGDQIDRDYLQQWAASLNVLDLLERAFTENDSYST